MKQISLLLLVIVTIIGCTHNTESNIKKLSIAETIEQNNRELIKDRIALDFNKSQEFTYSKIKELCPEVTQQQIDKWEEEGYIEYFVIDGEKRYFHSAARNLFRVNSQARELLQTIKGRQSDELDTFLLGYISQLPFNKSKKGENCANPAKMRVKYTLTVKPNQVPEGEVIRAWLPYPRECRGNRDIKLISTTHKNYIIAPDEYAHKSIYMEQSSVKDSAITFGYTLEYTGYNRWFKLSAEDIKPYNKESKLYKEYTKERKPHITFSTAIKDLTDSIVAAETNPLLKAQKIYYYITKTYPWASAREYSTIENIPEYVINSKHGDCGQVSLLFITMARYAGIPAKWQSGWMTHPVEINLHDWAEIYLEGYGWIPIDQSFGLINSPNKDVKEFYIGGLDCYRYIVNEDYSKDFYPAKTHLRSETVDFQRGEVEWRGENLYFNRWNYDMEVEYCN